jgi:hypothetical protein
MPKKKEPKTLPLPPPPEVPEASEKDMKALMDLVGGEAGLEAKAAKLVGAKLSDLVFGGMDVQWGRLPIACRYYSSWKDEYLRSPLELTAQELSFRWQGLASSLEIEAAYATPEFLAERVHAQYDVRKAAKNPDFTDTDYQLQTVGIHISRIESYLTILDGRWRSQIETNVSDGVETQRITPNSSLARLGRTVVDLMTLRGTLLAEANELKNSAFGGVETIMSMMRKSRAADDPEYARLLAIEQGDEVGVVEVERYLPAGGRVVEAG